MCRPAKPLNTLRHQDSNRLETVKKGGRKPLRATTQNGIGATLPDGINNGVSCVSGKLCCSRQSAGLNRVTARGAVVKSVRIM